MTIEIITAFIFGTIIGALAARVSSRGGDIQIYRELQHEGVEHGDEERRC